MESLSLASLSLASILAGVPAASDNEPVSQSVISTHISPAMAGSWVLQMPVSEEESQEAMQDTTMSDANTKTDNATVNRNSNTITGDVTNTVVVSDKTLNASTTVKPVYKNNCQESYTFAEDNKMWTVSGAEWTYGRYVVSHQDEGLPLIAINTIYDNNEADCSGNKVDQSGDMLLAYMDYESNKPYMRWCTDKEGENCFMTLKQQLP